MVAEVVAVPGALGVGYQYAIVVCVSDTAAFVAEVAVVRQRHQVLFDPAEHDSIMLKLLANKVENWI